MLALALVFTTVAFARVTTDATPAVRIKGKIDASNRVQIQGHVPGVVKSGAAKDLGRLAASTPAEHLVMVLKSSDEQKHELRRVLDTMHDKKTSNYHQWMTPDEFGQHFGVHDDDIATLKSWLTSQGFTVEDVSKSKRVLHFSGTTGQLENAFNIEMHQYSVDGELHVSNNRELSVPKAISPVVAGVTTHNFFRKAHMGNVTRLSQIKTGPNFTSSSTTHYVAPGDFAAIYNTAPLLAAGINGTGSSIAVVGRSDILMSDVQTYRQMFNLPANDPIFIHAGQDNGVNPGDDGESDLDVEISGGIAPLAQVYFVIGTPTFLVDGITNSIEYIVENNVADIISISYGSCEAIEGTGGNEFNLQAFEQAAAQGMSVFVASGDNGPAGCDNQGSQTYEVLGYATGGEASTPYSVSVGGSTLYGDVTSPTTYWSATNGTYFSSALTYIPESPWNESRSASYIPSGDTGSDLWSGSGGISAYYLKPSFQFGPGVPSSDPDLTQTAYGGQWVNSVTITNAGSGYTSAPAVTFTGGGCVYEPAATSTISGGSVTGITFTGYSSHYQGVGCTSVPTITFAAPTSGTTATATATIGAMQNPPPLITGVPHRYTPDLVLNAASGHDATLFCSEGVCQYSGSTLLDAGLVGGTSVAAPSMAGIQALINQANGGRQGMPAYIYYSLAAAQTTANCNSSTPPLAGSNCAFQDVTYGDNRICASSGSACTATAGTKIGFTAGTGYDLASGLGSVNAANLSSQWPSVTFNSSDTYLNLSQTTSIPFGTPVTVSGSVASGSGSGTPTGDVAFILSQGALGQTVNVNTGAWSGPGAFTTLSGGNYSASISNLPAGSYTLTARYGGDQTFGSSLSTPVAVTVLPEVSSTVTLTPQAINQSACTITNSSTFAYGALVWIQATAAGVSGEGVPTGTITFTVDGTAYTSVKLDSNGNGYLVAGTVPTSSCIYDYIFAQAPTLAAGTHTIVANYSGDSTYPASSATTTISVSQLAVTPTLTTGATFVNSGATVNLNASLTTSALTGITSTNVGPTGTVTFTDTTTSTVLGTVSVTPSVAFSGNTYTYSGAALLSTTGITTTGGNSITATYSGDTNFASATSTAVTVTVGTYTATSVAVTSSANPTTLNGRPTFTATLTPTTVTSGTVTFYDGTTVLGTGTVGTGHTATFRPASGAAFFGGTHSITAEFGGTSTYGAGVSPVLTETVTQGTAAITLDGGKTSGIAGSTFAFAAVLTPSQTNATYAPNRSQVNFYSDGTLIGSATPLTITSSQGGYGLWTATLSTTALTVGTHAITATYSDVNYSLTTSSTLSVTVTAAPAAITSPANGSTLTSATTTFLWSYNQATDPVYLHIGTALGGSDLVNIGPITGGSTTVSLPTTGATVYATLLSTVSGNLVSSTSTYKEASLIAATITSPTNGSTLTGASTTFTWSLNGATAPVYLHVGTTVGGVDLVNIGPITGGSTTVTLPVLGATIYVTLESQLNGKTVDVPYTYTEFDAPAVITSPASGSTLTGANTTFTWVLNGSVAPVYLHAGTTVGGVDLVNIGPITGGSTTVTLPTSGATIYVTLESQFNGKTVDIPYTYTEANLVPAAITSPTNGSTLTAASTTFTWALNGATAPVYLHIGTTAGGVDLVNIGPLSGTSTTVTLPVTGATIYATLESELNGRAVDVPYTYTEATLLPATITSPTNGSTLSGPTVTFTWMLNGATAPVYLHAGTTVGGTDLVNIGPITGGSTTVNLPTNGTTVYVTLESQVNGATMDVPYTYTEASLLPASITSPANGSQLGSTQTFTWVYNGSTDPVYLHIGSTPGGIDIVNIGPITGGSTTVNLPTDGATVYVTLESQVSGRTVDVPYTYTDPTTESPSNNSRNPNATHATSASQTVTRKK